MRKFKRIYIEITNICNLSCEFCPKTKRKYKFMDKKEFKEIIEKVKDHTDHVYFHIMGEPLLNENIGYFFEESYNNGLSVNLTTNGTLIKDKSDVLLNAKSLRQVNISLHSFEANDSSLKLHEYIENITDFIREAVKSTNIISAIRLWNMDNKELKGANALNNEILGLLEKNLNLDFSLSEKLQESHKIKISDRVYINMAEKFDWPDSKIDLISDDVFCHGIRSQIGILVDGTVVPCCLDSEGSINLGNIFNRSLEEIVDGERTCAMHEGFKKRKAVEELCKRCGYASRFRK